MKRILVFAVVMMTVCLSGYGQEPTTAESNHAAPVTQPLGQDQRFRLAFVVREVDEKGKALNSREYDVMIGAVPHQGDPNVSIRTGARVPVPTSPGNTQFTYLDVGVNFDVARFQVLSATRVAMNVQTEISSIDSASKEVSDHPVIRQNKWHGDEQMVLGERKVIFSSDDLASRNKVQVELTVTKVD